MARKTNKVLVVGAGGVGSWLAPMLLARGYDVIVVDGDRVEKRNLTRQNFLADDIDKYKIEALLRRYPKLKGIPKFFDEELAKALSNEKFDIVIDCTDNLEAQRLTEKFAKENGCRWIKIGTEKYMLTVFNQLPEFAEEDDDEPQRCGVNVRQYIEIQTMAASYGVLAVENMIRLPLVVTFKNDGGAR